MINILYLCHDLLDFDGTRGDMEFLLYRLKQYNIDYECYFHKTWEKVDLLDFDFVYAGVCPEKYQNIYIHNLKNNIYNISQYIEEYGLMLAIEQSFIFLGNSLDNKKSFLNILPIDILLREKYCIGNVLIDTKINNFQSKINGFINSKYCFEILSKKIIPFGKILLGTDYLWDKGYEGIIYKSFIGTQLRGPILPRNYDLCDFLIKILINKDELPKIDSEFEKKSKLQLTNECEKFIKEKRQEKEYIYVS